MLHFNRDTHLCINDSVRKNKQFTKMVNCALERDALKSHWKLDELLGTKLIKTLLHHIACPIKFQQGYSFIHFIQSTNNKQFSKIAHCVQGRDALESHWKLDELLSSKLIKTLLHHVVCAVTFQQGCSFKHQWWCPQKQTI